MSVKSAPGETQQMRKASEQLSRLADDYWEFYLREHPVVALGQGDERFRHELFKESISDFERRDGESAGLLQSLARLDVGLLGGQDQFTFQLLERELLNDREHFAMHTHLRPMLFPLGPEGWVADAVHKTMLFSRQQAQDYVRRVESIPAFFADYSERLWSGLDSGFRLPRVLLNRVCAAAQSYLDGPLEKSLWYGPFAKARSAGRIFEAEESAAQSLIETKIRPAYKAWTDMLKKRYASECRESIATTEEPGGEDYYRFLARYYTSSDLSAEEIHARGADEVARISADMKSIAGKTGHEDLAGLRNFLRTDAQFYSRSKEEILERIAILAKRIDRRIPEFFGNLPRMTYGIESVPESLAAQVPPAYAQPNPPNGTSAGIFWITSLPQRCPSYLHVPLTLHEAWPGHLMHIAMLQEMTGLPAFRRYGLANYTAFIEGWGLYCEQLGHDLGFYSDPFAHYGCLEMEMWRAVRLVVDTGIHMQGWSREQAIAYMRLHLTLDPATIEAEVDRYIGMPGQALAYKVGGFKFSELRERASSQLGDAFSLRSLHDRFMDAGPVTLDLLDQHVQAWIDATRSEKA